jgi:hypothetical protein
MGNPTSLKSPSKASFTAGASTSEGCSTEGFDRQAAKGRQAAPSEAQRDADGSEARQVRPSCLAQAHY